MSECGWVGGWGGGGGIKQYTFKYMTKINHTHFRVAKKCIHYRSEISFYQPL